MSTTLTDTATEYFNFWQSTADIFNCLLTIGLIVITVCAIIGFSLMFIEIIRSRDAMKAMETKTMKIGDTGVAFLVATCVCLALEAALLVAAIAIPYKSSEYSNLKQTIENQYNVEVVSELKLDHKIISTKIQSLSDDNQFRYDAYLVENGGEYKLCKQDIDGNFVPLTPKE